ncbi:MAG: LysR family transcriptional regulator [Vulcanimicrobiaceae bacterium]
MDVTLTQLESLRRIAHHRSFTKAAKSLGITQPAVSQQLAALQRSLGIRLVETERSRPRLTQAGRFVASRAERIGEQIDALIREVKEYAHAERGELHVAATLTIGTYVLPGMLRAFCASRPEVTPNIEIVNTSTVAARVLAGEVAIGLIEGAVSDSDINVQRFGGDRLVLIVPPHGHPLSDATSIVANALAEYAFVSRETGSGTRDHGYEMVQRRGIKPEIALELPNGEAIVCAVEAGWGVAILSELAVERAIAVGSVHPVAIEDLALDRDFCIVTAHERALAPVAHEFLDTLRTS